MAVALEVEDSELLVQVLGKVCLMKLLWCNSQSYSWSTPILAPTIGNIVWHECNHSRSNGRLLVPLRGPRY